MYQGVCVCVGGCGWVCGGVWVCVGVGVCVCVCVCKSCVRTYRLMIARKEAIISCIEHAGYNYLTTEVAVHC